MLKLEFDFEFYQKFGLGLENRLQEPEQLADTARSQAIYYRIFLRNYRAQMSIIRTQFTEIKNLQRLRGVRLRAGIKFFFAGLSSPLKHRCATQTKTNIFC